MITLTFSETNLRVSWIMPRLGVVPPSTRLSQSSMRWAPAFWDANAPSTESTQTSNTILIFTLPRWLQAVTLVMAADRNFAPKPGGLSASKTDNSDMVHQVAPGDRSVE